MKKVIDRKVDECGRIRLPPEILRAWNIEFGGDVILDFDESAVLIIPSENDVEMIS